MRTNTTMKLRSALSELTKYLSSRLADWRKYSKSQGFAPSREHWADWCASPGYASLFHDYNWTQRCYAVAAAVMEMENISSGHTPWPRIKSDDIVDAINNIISGGQCVDQGVPPVDALQKTLYEALQSMIRPAQLSLWLPVQCESAYDELTFRKAFEGSVAGGIQEISAAWEGDWEGDDQRYLRVLLKAHVTARAKDSFEKQIFETLWQTALLSTIDECLPSSTRSIHGALALPRTTFSCWDRDYDFADDGDSQQDRDFQNPEEFIFKGTLNRIDPLRFKWLCTDVAFSTPPGCNTSNSQRRRDTLRHCIWSMAEASQLPNGALAMGRYAGILENAMSVLKFNSGDFRDGPGSVANLIAEACNLSHRATQELQSLFARRNKVVHELSYNVSGRDVRTFWRLAKAAVHHLVAKLSSTYSQMEHIQDREIKEERIKKDRFKAFMANPRKILAGFGLAGLYDKLIAPTSSEEPGGSDSGKREYPGRTRAEILRRWGEHDIGKAMEEILLDPVPETYEF